MRKTLHNERGFTLPELMIVIVLLGILAAIAIPSWWGVVEGRKATSAANQVAADLRLSHTRATNRLADWQFEVTASGEYRMGSPGSLSPRPLPDGITLAPAVAMNFKSDGGVRKPDGTALANPTNILVRDGNGNTVYTLRVNTLTSRVEID